MEQVITGSSPVRHPDAEAAAERTATCLESRSAIEFVGVRLLQLPLLSREDAAEGTATGLENQGAGDRRGSIPPSSVCPLEAEK